METVKLVSNVVHMTTGGFLAGAIVLNYLFDTNEFLIDVPDYFEFA